MKPQTALYNLKTDPVGFLRNNFISIPGGRNVSGPMQCYIGSHTLATIAGRNESFKMSFNSGSMTGEVYAIPSYVQYVRMIDGSEDFELWDIPGHDLNAFPGDLMITSQLSACTFCVLRKGGSTIVAHLQPGHARGDRNMMRQRVSIQGRFRNHPNDKMSAVYGSGDYTNRCNVIGIRNGGNWTFYAQNWDGSATNPTITTVNRF